MSNRCKTCQRSGDCRIEGFASQELVAVNSLFSTAGREKTIPRTLRNLFIRDMIDNDCLSREEAVNLIQEILRDGHFSLSQVENACRGRIQIVKGKLEDCHAVASSLIEELKKRERGKVRVTVEPIPE